MIKGLKNIMMITDTVQTGNIGIENGKISDINTNGDFEGIAFPGRVYVLPGFIDEHVHGAFGADVMDASIPALKTIAKALAAEGTVGFLATTITQSDEHIKAALKNVKDYMEKYNDEGARVLGVHLEGPFLNPSAAGAQPEQYIINPDIGKFKEYQELSGNNIKMITIAPETNEAMALIRYCQDTGVTVSVGHTKAAYLDVLAAIRNGADTVTHCFNAVTPLHHREIGVVGAALLCDELNAELIADGIHVCPEAIRLLYKNKGTNITLVTDSIRAKGMSDGVYDLGGQLVTVTAGKALLNGKTLAGSVLKMNDALKNFCGFTGADLVQGTLLTSGNAAKKLHLRYSGRIEIGMDADLTVIDENYQVLLTLSKGNMIYGNERLKWR